MNKMRRMVWMSALLLVSLCGYSQELYMTGLLPDDGRYDKLPCKYELRSQDYNSLPSSYSLKRYCPVPKSQGGFGTCVGWATAYAARTIAEAVRLNMTDQTRINKEAFSPLFVYAQIKHSGDDDCQHGTRIDEALNLMKRVGAVKFESFNMLCADNVSQQLKNIAQIYKITDFYTLFNNNELFHFTINKVKKVKKAISQNNPVIISFNSYPSFHKAGEVWNGDDNDSYRRHALCVVGYDDHKYGGAFQIMNSWGTSWGDNGFTWIKYRDFEKHVNQAFEMFVKKFDINSIRNPIMPSLPKLSGSILLRQPNGSSVRANYNQQQKVYKASSQSGQGSRYCIDITNKEPSYIYVIGIDSRNRAQRVFPANDYVSAAVTYPNSHISIPSEDSYLPAPNSSDGYKRLCVLFSQDALDFDKVIRDMNANVRAESFAQRLGTGTSNLMVPMSRINYTPNTISANAQTDKGFIPVIIDL